MYSFELCKASEWNIDTHLDTYAWNMLCPSNYISGLGSSNDWWIVVVDWYVCIFLGDAAAGCELLHQFVDGKHLITISLFAVFIDFIVT